MSELKEIICTDPDGLRVRVSRVTRTGYGYTQTAAQKAAEERNAKWPHQRTTVCHKDDPLPATVAEANGARYGGRSA